MNITLYHFEEIYKAGYTLDMLYLLKLIEEGNDASSLCENERMSVLCQTVRRKGLLSENFKITLIGKSVLGFLDEK